MAKMVDIEKLKPLLQPLLNEENEAATIEGILGIAEDFDEEAINKRQEDAVTAAREEAKKEYADKLHEMFFGGVSTERGQVDDSKTDPEIQSNHREVEDIFTTE